MDDFVKALNGAKGDLDAWLECNNEAECRVAIFAAIEDSVAAERERCAKVCEAQAAEQECPERAQYCADAVRMRSNEATLANDTGGWITTREALPEIETPALIFMCGDIVVGERRWDYPAFEDAYKAFWYWDNPVDDGQEWERGDVTHWMPLPAPPTSDK